MLIPVRDKVREVRKDEEDIERARKRQKKIHDKAVADEAAGIVDSVSESKKADEKKTDDKKKDDNIVVTPVFRDGDDLSIEVELESVRPFLQLFYVQADQSAKEVFRGMIDKVSHLVRVEEI